MAEKQGIVLRQSYKRTLKKLLLDQRFRNHPKNRGKAVKADRKVKTIAGRLVRELERKLPAGSHGTDLALFHKVRKMIKTRFIVYTACPALRGATCSLHQQRQRTQKV